MTVKNPMGLHGALQTLFSDKGEEWFEAAQQVLAFAMTVPESPVLPMRNFETEVTEGSVTSGATPEHGIVAADTNSKEHREWGMCGSVQRVGAYKLWRQKGMPFVTLRHYKSDFPFIDYTVVDSFSEFWLFYTPEWGAVLLGEAHYERKALRWWMRMVLHASVLVRYVQLRLRYLMDGSRLEFHATPFCFGVASCTVLRSAFPALEEGDDVLAFVKKTRS